MWEGRKHIAKYFCPRTLYSGLEKGALSATI